MKNISLLLSVIFLAGCAASLAEIKEEARECVKQAAITNSIQSDSGIVTAATAEQRANCWVDVNKKLEAQAKSEERRKAIRQCCTDRFGKPIMGRCKCISREEVREIFKRAGRY